MTCNSGAGILTFDIAAFRANFPAFANSTTYPDATLQSYWDQATCIVSDLNYGWLRGDCRQLALNLLTAHLAALATLIAAGQVPEIVQSATIDKITVGLTPPPFKNQWGWWMNTTPYGMQLYVMLQAKSVGGLYIGGLPERSAIRKVYGVFN